MLFVSLCHQARWWRPGRVETSRHCGARWVLYAPVCLELSWLFGLRSLTPPSPFALNISWKGWCWACACSSKLILPIFIQQWPGWKGMWTKDCIHALTYLLLSHRLHGFLSYDLFAMSLTTVDNVDSSLPNLRMRSRQREFDSMPHPSCFQAISLLSPLCRQTSSTQHKLSTNSLQMQPFVSLSASAEDELTTLTKW